MALSSNFYQQIWWTGKGIVRFSDSLALGKASTWLEKALTRKFWNLLERKIEKEKKWRKVGQIVKLQSANNFKSQTCWKCCMSASVRILNLAQRWNQKSTTHWVPMTGGGRFPESRGHRSAARNPDGQDFTYNLFRTPAPSSYQVKLPSLGFPLGNDLRPIEGREGVKPR